jgi:Zn-dependent protease
MTGNTLRLGRLFGIDFNLDYSWFIIFALVAWSLVSHYFPMTHSGWSIGVYWIIGVVTALLFFSSVVAHELAHSFMAQAQGIPVRGITLFIFGGVAEIGKEPKTAWQEFLIALAGPAASLILAALFGSLWWISVPKNTPIHALAGWLGWINLILALFNLIPGFPLDGGRVFRAVVWGATGNFRRATRIAAGVGRFVAFGFILWGIWQIFNGNWANGLWIAFIGWFLESAATSSYRQLALNEMLSGHKVHEVMTTDCTRILPRLTLDVIVDHIVLPGSHRCLVVMEEDQIQGLLTLHRIKRIPRKRWTTTRVEDVMIPLSQLKTINPDDELIVVFEQMATEDINQFPVLDVQEGHLLGIVGRDNILNFLRTQAELGS